MLLLTCCKVRSSPRTLYVRYLFGFRDIVTNALISHLLQLVHYLIIRNLSHSILFCVSIPFH